VHLGTQDDLITFLDQNVKVQGDTIAAEAHSTRRYRRVQIFLVMSLLKTYNLEVAIFFVRLPLVSLRGDRVYHYRRDGFLSLLIYL